MTLSSSSLLFFRACPVMFLCDCCTVSTEVAPFPGRLRATVPVVAVDASRQARICGRPGIRVLKTPIVIFPAVVSTTTITIAGSLLKLAGAPHACVWIVAIGAVSPYRLYVAVVVMPLDPPAEAFRSVPMLIPRPPVVPSPVIVFPCCMGTTTVSRFSGHQSLLVLADGVGMRLCRLC